MQRQRSESGGALASRSVRTHWLGLGVLRGMSNLVAQFSQRVRYPMRVSLRIKLDRCVVDGLSPACNLARRGHRRLCDLHGPSVFVRDVAFNALGWQPARLRAAELCVRGPGFILRLRGSPSTSYDYLDGGRCSGRKRGKAVRRRLR